MTTQATSKPLRSGFCGVGNPPESHARCSGGYEGRTCPCDCHVTRGSDVRAPEPFGPTPVTEPGLVYDMSDEDYHADPVPEGSLSSTFARLLTEHVPAKARELRKRPSTRTMEFGSLMHRVLFGLESLSDYEVGHLTVIEGDGRTKAVKEAKAQAQAAGLFPVGPAEFEARASQYEQMSGMVDAVRSHPQIAALFDAGLHEVSAFWRDEATGVWCRARFDILPAKGRDMIAHDYKTARDASRRGFQKAMANFAYHQQGEFYLRALKALGIASDPKFRFVAQEIDAPYLLNLHEPDAEAMDAARVLNDRAIRTYAECVATDVWPGYEIDPEPLRLPNWYFYDHEAALGLTDEEMVTL